MCLTEPRCTNGYGTSDDRGFVKIPGLVIHDPLTQD